MDKHTYKSLETDNHIRVLILHPAQNPSTPLQCSIKQQELGTGEAQYECISYTWGDRILTHTLNCDNGSVIEITSNLHSALSRFRSTSHSRHLWTDAVCINQADAEEKSRQIPLMSRIYQDASRVLVWLGDGTNGESKTMQSLARWRNSEPQFPESKESINKFFRLPWFSRRWVVQEVVLNIDILFHCGISEISWPRLYFAIESLPDSTWEDILGREIRKSLEKLSDLWKQWSSLDRNSMNCELFHLLDSFHHFQCKEDKDRIYALAGIATDIRSNLMPVIPNYSLSDDEVFHQVALQRMQSGRAYSTLAYAGALRPRDGSRTLQSWASDFRLEKRWRTMLKEPNSSYQSKIELRSDGSLSLKGKLLIPFRHSYADTRNTWKTSVVRHVFPGPKHSEPQSMLQSIHDSLQWMYAIPTLVELEKNDQIAALFDVLLTAAAKLSELVPDNKSITKRFQSILDNEDNQNIFLEEISPYISTIFRGLVGRCIFLSNTITVSERWGEEDLGGYYPCGIGLLGIGPEDLLDGDVIVRFSGVEESLFFRPQDGQHQVLGDGYFTVIPSRLRHAFTKDSQYQEIIII